ncbi:T9SS type A sorting domain-containing protein [bacterium SCSIO 12741]|nr:T9SS type A sorting domain-containing protein [bacterium SCSIO 12741]
MNFLSLNAQKWAPVGVGFDRPPVLYTDTFNDLLYAGGQPKYSADSILLRGIASYDGNQLKPLNKASSTCGFNFCSFAQVMQFYKGALFVKAFNETLEDTINALGLASWNGNQWSSVGGGVRYDDTGSGDIREMVVHNNRLHVAGSFRYAGNVLANKVAAWDGNKWTSVDSDTSFWTKQSWIETLAFYRDELYIGGTFRTEDKSIHDVARWDGSTWQPVGTTYTMFDEGLITDMIVYKDELYIGGFFLEPNSPGNFVARWNGTNWNRVGDGLRHSSGGGFVSKMEIVNDKLLITGMFDQAGDIPVDNIVTWDGLRWCTFDTTNSFGSQIPVDHFTYFRDTFYIETAEYLNGDTMNYFAKWNGSLDPVSCSKEYPLSIYDNEGIVTTNEFRIYPNPANQELRIILSQEGTERLSWQVTDMNGKQYDRSVLHQSRNTEAILNTAELPPGIYFLNINGKYARFGVVR